ncbi:hypothetical protein [Amycolatopsis pigmentata]|uniref:Uncharacterized protein n=1 Tax=Amycolatopsis pigmentata TaxID=450801 RepID=A0ABW5FP29_9PSEU
MLDSADLTDRLVWTKAGGDEPDWVGGGSYHVVRKERHDRSESLLRPNVTFQDFVA